MTLGNAEWFRKGNVCVEVVHIRWDWDCVCIMVL